MPPKGAGRRKPGAGTASDGSATPLLPSLAEQLSYNHLPRPFKNLAYNKNINRRAKNLKAVLSQEREREKVERERRRLAKLARLEKQAASVDAQTSGNEAMDVDVEANASESKADGEEVAASLKLIEAQCEELDEEVPTYTSIEAPPSVWPQRHYCDITGLEAPYTDPATGLRFYDKSIYEIVKGLSTSTAKEYLSARGVNTIVK